MDHEAKAAPLETTFDLQGDLRLRYEYNEGGTAPDRQRGTMRARVAGALQLRPGWLVGARLTTGSADDPNSSDTTLGNFGDDLQVSLDRAFVQYTGMHSALWAGRFENPFRTTDLVWDSDVNLSGAAVTWRSAYQGPVQFGFTSALAIIDEQTTGSDSTLVGLQSHFEFSRSNAWRVGFDLAYYDYSIGALTNADAGDTRENRLSKDGSYLSDFEVLDVIGSLTVANQTRWPLTISANVVSNLGAATGDQESGYRVALTAGRLAERGSLSMGYAYSAAEADAVFAAYAQDNIAYGSNYRLHELWLKYRLSRAMDFNLIGYDYRPWRSTDSTPSRTRVRLNWVIRF